MLSGGHQWSKRFESQSPHLQLSMRTICKVDIPLGQRRIECILNVRKTIESKLIRIFWRRKESLFVSKQSYEVIRFSALIFLAHCPVGDYEERQKTDTMHNLGCKCSVKECVTTTDPLENSPFMFNWRKKSSNCRAAFTRSMPC